MNNERDIEKNKDNKNLSGVNYDKNWKLLSIIENTPQLPQVQYDLERQLRELRVMANRLGLYDAADFLKNSINHL